MTPQYTAVAGRVLQAGRPVREPLVALSVHRLNASYWLTNTVGTAAQRESLAAMEYRLADELEAAIRAAELQATGEMASV